MDIEIHKADLTDPNHQRDTVSMMDAYARDPMGDGKPLSSYARNNLITGLDLDLRKYSFGFPFERSQEGPSSNLTMYNEPPPSASAA